MSKKLPAEQRKSIEEATAEAEARPLDYDPATRARYIRSMMVDIPAWKRDGDSEEVIRNRIPEFIERYPELFKKIMDGSDLTPIQSMLTMLDQMGDGKLNQHQASIIVGKKLMDRYITPQLNSKDRK